MNSLISWPVTIFLVSVTHCYILTELYTIISFVVLSQRLFANLLHNHFFLIL